MDLFKGFVIRGKGDVDNIHALKLLVTRKEIFHFFVSKYLIQDNLQTIRYLAILRLNYLNHYVLKHIYY